MRLDRSILSASCLAVLALGLSAQAPTVSKFGGAAPGTTTLTVNGNAGNVYLLIGALAEVQTPIFTGAVLDISLGLLSTTINLPGFLGVLDGSGTGVGTVSLPNDTSLYSMVLSFQALQGPNYDAASNLVRVTPQAPSSFQATLGDAPLPTFAGAATTLPDGRTLIVETSAVATQIYDHNLEEFELGLPILGGGLFSTVTPLDDGRVFVAGGLDLTGTPTDAAGVFDPATGTLTALTMSSARAGHGATLLGNGRVLISGGFSSFDTNDILGTIQGVLISTEIYNPQTGLITNGPNMLEGRAFHTSSQLGNGGALVAGGISVIPFINLPTISATSYAYNPNSNSFGLPTTFSTGRFMHSAVTLADGRVALVGGLSVDLTTFLQTQDVADIVVGSLGDVQVYTPGFLFASYSTVGSLGTPRAGVGLAALPDGGALVVGGFSLSLGGAGPISATGSASADRILSGANGVTALGDLAETRILPLCTPLADGTVLIVGGGTNSATVWQP